MSNTSQFRSTQTPSGKVAFEAWCAVYRMQNGDEITICAPTIDKLEKAWSPFVGGKFNREMAQHVWLVAFDGGAPKDARRRMRLRVPIRAGLPSLAARAGRKRRSS